MPWVRHDRHGNRLTAGADTLSDLYKRIYLWRLACNGIKIRIEALKEPKCQSGGICIVFNYDSGGREIKVLKYLDAHVAWRSACKDFLEFNLRPKLKVARRPQLCDHALKAKADDKYCSNEY